MPSLVYCCFTLTWKQPFPVYISASSLVIVLRRQSSDPTVRSEITLLNKKLDKFRRFRCTVGTATENATWQKIGSNLNATAWYTRSWAISSHRHNLWMKVFFSVECYAEHFIFLTCSYFILRLYDLCKSKACLLDQWNRKKQKKEKNFVA